MTKRNAKAQIEGMQTLTQGAAAWLLTLNPRTIRNVPTMPRNDDGTYNARDLTKWAKDQASGATDGDPLLAGGPGASPALERYREHRAALAGLELHEKQGRLIDVDELAEWFEAEVAGPIRRATLALKRKHGPDAARIIEKALAKAGGAVRKRGRRDK